MIGLPMVVVYSEGSSRNHYIFAVPLVLKVAVWLTVLCTGEIPELDLDTEASNFNLDLSWLSLDTPSILSSPPI
jgi:hypothetical protein